MGKVERRASVSDLLQKLNQRSGGRCEGYRLGLDCNLKLAGEMDPRIHHMDGDPRSNEMDNLVLLCPNCHFGAMERLSEKRRKIYARKAAESLDRSSFHRK